MSTAIKVIAPKRVYYVPAEWQRWQHEKLPKNASYFRRVFASEVLELLEEAEAEFAGE